MLKLLKHLLPGLNMSWQVSSDSKGETHIHVLSLKDFLLMTTAS